jgi:uncharacterized protein
VPPEQSRAVAEAAPRLLQLIEVKGADHNARSLSHGDVLVDAVISLAEQA